MTDSIIIIGAGGHAKVVADIILASGGTVAGFLDGRLKGNILGIPILGKLDKIPEYSGKNAFVIGVGDNKSRMQIDSEVTVKWYTAIHPSAVISSSVQIGEGTVIMAGAVINTSAEIGRHCIINTGAIVEHDNRIEDFVHISPGATLCGTVRVGALTHIGAGAVISNNISICGNCTIGAGAVVVEDIVCPGTYVGVPAKLLRKIDK